ncbi:hypothetical protein ACT3UQ_15480 [Glutamicibacter sp. AOP12-B1-11]|uniref:hypothetical protein n=1 Tax=Glutamicibacter sp. AOP12-B1-11 TaxID=3457725 RepID=UPI004033C6F7
MQLTKELLHEIYDGWAEEFRERMPEARYVFPHVNDEDGVYEIHSYIVLDGNYNNISPQYEDGVDTIALRAIGLSQEILKLMEGEDLRFETSTGQEIVGTSEAYKAVWG